VPVHGHWRIATASQYSLRDIDTWLKRLLHASISQQKFQISLLYFRNQFTVLLHVYSEEIKNIMLNMGILPALKIGESVVFAPLACALKNRRKLMFSDPKKPLPFDRKVFDQV
jgi:hypothetical protein